MSCVAIDCEMVSGPGNRNMAARVSLVNERGDILMDEYIKPQLQITDYRTPYSGITPEHLKYAQNLSTVKSRVAQLIHGRILVGHTLDTDLEVLELNHPVNMRRDLADRFHSGGQRVSLKILADKLLGKTIQNGPHCSVEDAKASMEIYRKHWN